MYTKIEASYSVKEIEDFSRSIDTSVYLHHTSDVKITRMVDINSHLSYPNDGIAYSKVSAFKSHEIDELKGIGLLITDVPIPIKNCQLIVNNPQEIFIKLIPYFFKEASPVGGIHPSVSIGKGVKYGSGVNFGPNVVIGDNCDIGDRVSIYPNSVIYPNVKIGDDTVIHSNVTITLGVKIGANVLIQSGSVLGSIGFGYRPNAKGELELIPHTASLIIEDNVDIGANVTIDRGVIKDTTIKSGTKIDNLVQIGHNSQIGKHVIICGQVGIAGSCNIEDRVTLGGKVGVADHIHISSGIRVGGYSGVTKSLTIKGDYAGFPARPIKQWLRQQAQVKKLE